MLALALLASVAVVPLSFISPAVNITLPERTGVNTTPVASPTEAVVTSPPLATAAATTAGGCNVVPLRPDLARRRRRRRGPAGCQRDADPRRGRARLPVEDGRWLDVLDTVAARYGVTRLIGLYRTDSTSLLATWGLRRPHVLLPRQSGDWTLDRVHVVLCHELAHVRRHDWLVQIGAEAVRVLLWFNPLAWITCTRLRRESEQACDDEVLGMGVGSRAYASHLLELARQCRRPGPTWVSAMPMAHPSTLERRIAAMLNPRLDRRTPSRYVMATLAVVLLLVTLPVAALRARQAGPSTLSGTIYDTTGGVLPGVEVVLVDKNEITSVVASNANGRFEFPAVAPGKYTLGINLAGFRALRQEFELRDARDWSRAVTLQVGDLRETITVRESRVAAPKPASPAGVPQPVRVGGNIRAPRKTLDVRPVYPASMREAGLMGVVPIEAIIGRDGVVLSVRVLSAADPSGFRNRGGGRGAAVALHPDAPQRFAGRSRDDCQRPVRSRGIGGPPTKSSERRVTVLPVRRTAGRVGNASVVRPAVARDASRRQPGTCDNAVRLIGYGTQVFGASVSVLHDQQAAGRCKRRGARSEEVVLALDVVQRVRHENAVERQCEGPGPGEVADVGLDAYAAGVGRQGRDGAGIPIDRVDDGSGGESIGQRPGEGAVPAPQVGPRGGRGVQRHAFEHLDRFPVAHKSSGEGGGCGSTLPCIEDRRTLGRTVRTRRR